MATVKKPKESDIVKAALDYLEMRGVLAWRNNSGAVVSNYTRKGDGVTKSRFIRYGKPGSGDILGVLPNGKFLSVECKKPKASTKPKIKELQELFAARVNTSGGVAVRIETLDDLHDVVNGNAEYGRRSG